MSTLCMHPGCMDDSTDFSDYCSKHKPLPTPSTATDDLKHELLADGSLGKQGRVWTWCTFSDSGKDRYHTADELRRIADILDAQNGKR